jgi:hypothetical protein
LDQLAGSGKLTDIELDSFFKFTFVRNPWDKVISECFCRHIQLAFRKCTNIKDRIIKVCSLVDGSGYGGHCMRQVDYILSPTYGLDFIGRYESLHQHFSYICSGIGLDGLNLPHTHKSQKKNYREYYDQETIDLVARTYEIDILEFNYDY